MDVITRTTFHLQARNRKTDDQAETGPDRVGTVSGSEPTSETCAPDSMSFNEFHFLMNFTSRVVSPSDFSVCCHF